MIKKAIICPPIAIRPGIFGCPVFLCNWLIGLFVFICAIYSTTAWATDWLALVQQAVEVDPRVLSARAHLRVRDADVEGAWGAYYPVVHGKGSLGSVANEDPLSRDGGKRTWGLEVKQPIPLFGHERAEVDRAQASVRVEETSLRQTEQHVAVEFLEVALRLRSAVEVFQLHEQLVRLLAKQHHGLEEAVAGGGATLPELRQAQSRVAQSHARRGQAQSEVQILRARMGRLLSRKSLPSAMTDAEFDQLQSILTPMTLEIALERAVTQAPALLQSQAELALAKVEQDAAKVGYWPRVTMNAQVQRGSFGSTSANSMELFIGATQPIYEGGITSAKVDRAAHQFVAAKEAVRQEQRMVEERVKDTWVRWKARKAAVRFWQQAEAEEIKVIDLTREKVNSGVGTRIVLMKAMEDWTETRQKGAEQRLERNLAWLQFLKEAGSITGHAMVLSEGKGIKQGVPVTIKQGVPVTFVKGLDHRLGQAGRKAQRTLKNHEPFQIVVKSEGQTGPVSGRNDDQGPVKRRKRHASGLYLMHRLGVIGRMIAQPELRGPIPTMVYPKSKKPLALRLTYHMWVSSTGRQK